MPAPAGAALASLYQTRGDSAQGVQGVDQCAGADGRSGRRGIPGHRSEVLPRLDYQRGLADGVGDPVRVRIQEVTRTVVTVAPTVNGAVGEVAKSIDPAASITLSLPTERLCPAS